MNSGLVVDNIADTNIRESQVHGKGLFTNKAIKKGSVLCVLDGQVIEYNLYEKNELAIEWNAIENDFLLVRPYRTKYSYINHSRTPNLEVTSWPLKVIAIRDISEGEELLLDYRKEPLPQKYIESHGKTYL